MSVFILSGNALAAYSPLSVFSEKKRQASIDSAYEKRFVSKYYTSAEKSKGNYSQRRTSLQRKLKSCDISTIRKN